jgi:hypothetical protein
MNVKLPVNGLSCNRGPGKLKTQADVRLVRGPLSWGAVTLQVARHAGPVLAQGRHGSRTIAVVTLAIGLFQSLPACLAQEEPGPTVNDYLSSGPPEPSRDEWRQRVEEAKRRAKDVARERREHPELYVPIPEDPDIVASERVLESLQRGDIVTTKKGTFVYQGRLDQPRREGDFVPIAPGAKH